MYEAALVIGEVNVVIITDNEALYRLAQKRLFIQEKRKNNKQIFVKFIKNNTVDTLINKTIAKNAVHIERQKQEGKTIGWLMKVFNMFCIEIKEIQNVIQVTYSDKAVYSYLLDDVLQAAIASVLKRQNGFILHGACLVKDDKAIALLGPSGSGKSTSAYNLMRGGYQCFADDAVIVIKKHNALWVWPFSRELSLRPLSYNLLKENGMTYQHYRRDGSKYYFSQEKQYQLQGVRLSAICLIDVAGEQKTTHSPLCNQKCVEKLVGQKKYFSFINREHNEYYAQTICNYVQKKYISKMGSDLNAQIKSIDQILDINSDTLPDITLHQKNRQQKKQIIKTAWMEENESDISQLIPLLADSDLKVYETLLAFFQNYSTAQICLTNKKPEKLDVKKLPVWIKGEQWQQGCYKLAEKTNLEMINEYAAGWLTSAPMLYAFLYHAFDGVKRERIIQKWGVAKKNIRNIIRLTHEIDYHDVNSLLALNSQTKNKTNENDIFVIIKHKDLNQNISQVKNIIENTRQRIFIKTTCQDFCLMPEELIKTLLEHNQYALSLTDEK